MYHVRNKIVINIYGENLCSDCQIEIGDFSDIKTPVNVKSSIYLAITPNGEYEVCYHCTQNYSAWRVKGVK